MHPVFLRNAAALLTGFVCVCVCVCRYVLGWEDASAEAPQLGSDFGVKSAKAKRQSKAEARNDKSAPLFPILVHGVRKVLKGEGFDKDTAPQTHALAAETAEEARQWASAINTATQSLAHDAMSIGLQTCSARAVKLLVIEDGTPGQAVAATVPGLLFTILVL